MLLLITKSIDKTADHVLHRMEERGVECLRVNSDCFGEANIELCFSAVNDSVLAIGDRQVNLVDIQAIWLRRLAKPEASHIHELEPRQFAEQELDFTLRWLIDLLSYRCLVIDHETNILRGRNKFTQLEVAPKLGMQIPATLITNNPKRAREFVQRYHNVAIKSVAGYGRKVAGGFYTAYTQQVTSEILEQFDSISLAPACLQEYIEKAFELRITVVGSKVFSCRIDSQDTERTRIDWRRYDISTPYSIYTIDDELSGMLIRMMKYYNVHFASFDFIVTPDGRYIFLEMNPASQFIWVERLTGMPITDALIDDLLVRSCQ